MSFYLKPPRGEIHFHKLVECVKQRLNFYDNLQNNTIEIPSFDCLVEDSPLDRTGHYLFRLLACSNYVFREIFLRNEQKLLLLRLNSYNVKDVRYFVKVLLKQSKDVLEKNEDDEKVIEVINWLFRICSQILRKEYLNHVLNEFHLETAECDRFTLKVPFSLCASLLDNRQINLYKGFVLISCKDWKQLVLSLFKTFLRRVLEVMNYNRNVEMALHDDRIEEVLKLVKNHCFIDDSDSAIISKFDITNIHAESRLFPLCMLNLYKVLQMTNRLSHNDRYDFSLYMKGIGVSITDSIKFWEAYYSKQHAACSNCTHDWQKNEKRYIYGIRHLYGLEGSRKNYQVRSCQYLQEKSLCAAESGGCPFKHFDDTNLRKVLKKLLPNKPDETEVMIYKRKKSPSESCKIFYETIFETIKNKSVNHDTKFQNPVGYYLSLKNLVMGNS